MTARSCFRTLVIVAIVLVTPKAVTGQTVRLALEGFKLVPGGTFHKGDIVTEDNRPLVRVEPFEILDHPVTNREYKRFVDATRWTPPLHWTRGRIPVGKEDHPVIFVNRADVAAYLAWLSKPDGRQYRLPTSAEFEYAARGGEDGGKYPWGEGDPAGKANFDADGKRVFTQWTQHLQPSRSGPPNRLELFGMAGNVWQMVAVNSDPVTSRYKYRIEEPETSEGTVGGGSWARGAEYLRCGYFVSVSAGSRQPDLGFRPIRAPEGIDWRFEPRRLVAQPLGQGSVLLSWALLASDSAATSFNIYRSESRAHAGFRINQESVRTSSTFLDTGLRTETRHHYYVRPVKNGGREGRRSEWAGASVTDEPELTVTTFLPLAREGGLVPIFGDLDGDGQLDCVIRLDNGNVEMSQDPGVPVQLEAFTSYGRSLWRLSVSQHDHCFGNNNNVPFNVWDMDGDGKAEVITRLQIGDKDYVAILDGMTGRVKGKAEWPAMVSDFERSSTRIHLSVVYLDGKHPAVVTQTGLYENEVITAYDASLKKLWEFHSFAETSGSGGHKIEAADVDGDGRQEVFVGTMCLNPDGTLRWSIYRQHPDIVSVHDYLPSRPGLEVFYIVESSQHAGVYMVDAKSGEILWKHNREEDSRWTHGHAGWSADISASSPGLECASNRAGHGDVNWVLYSSTGRVLVEPFPAGYTPFEWDGDETRELLSSDGKTIGNFNGTSIVPQHGLPPNPFPDARVVMTADICGDFRDELILTVAGENGRKGIAVVMATSPINARFVSRTEDFEYRLWLARNMGGGYKSIFDQPLQPPRSQALTELLQRERLTSLRGY